MHQIGVALHALVCRSNLLFLQLRNCLLKKHVELCLLAVGQPKSPLVRRIFQEATSRQAVTFLNGFNLADQFIHRGGLKAILLHLLEAYSQQLEFASAMHAADVATEGCARLGETHQLSFDDGVGLAVLF
jgi:hypothetical protein